MIGLREIKYGIKHASGFFGGAPRLSDAMGRTVNFSEYGPERRNHMPAVTFLGQWAHFNAPRFEYRGPQAMTFLGDYSAWNAPGHIPVSQPVLRDPMRDWWQDELRGSVNRR